MANTIDWGQGAVNNTNNWGKGKTNATNNWGAIYDSTAAGETNITGSGGVAPFTNTYSMSFDGVDEYMNVADNDNLSFGNGTTDSPFSISAWVKMNDATRFRIVGKYDSNLEYLFSTGGTDKIVFNCYDNSTSARIGRQYSTALTSFEGQWIHLVATYNGSSLSSGLKIYLNGSRVDDTDSNSGTYTAMENTTAPLEIGKNLTTYANGLIDETAIFNSELLASNVTAIYNGGAPTDLTSLSPLSWWRMGDGDSWGGSSWTLTDNGSGGNDATSVNIEEADRLPISPNSYTQNSFSFDGVDEYFEIGSPTSIQSLTSEITISFWIKAPRVFTTNYYTPLSKGEYAAVGSQWSIKVNTANARNTSGGAFTVFPNSNAITDIQSVVFPTPVDDNQWHHMMFVNDGTDLKVYIDGQLDATGLGKGRTLYNGNRSLKLGRLTASASVGLLQGNLDEVAIFGTALGLTEAQTIFNNGIPQDISSLSPVSHWRMGESATWNGSIWTLTDQGSGGNNATSVNMEEADKTGDQAYVI